MIQNQSNNQNRYHNQFTKEKGISVKADHMQEEISRIQPTLTGIHENQIFSNSSEQSTSQMQRTQFFPDQNMMNVSFGASNDQIISPPSSQNEEATKKQHQTKHAGLISIEEFSKIAPNVKALQELCSLQGFYTPKDASMKWLLRKYIEQRLPVLNQVKKCPSYSKPTKQDCLNVIRQFCPDLEPEERHDLEWLRDISYTVSNGEHEIFNAYRSQRGSKSKATLQSSISFKLPSNIDDLMLEKLQQKYKPERMATTKLLKQLKEKMDEKLVQCCICLDNTRPMCYTVCCSQPLHKICSDRMNSQRCPYCKNSQQFMLQTKIQDYTRAYNTLN
ncbi:hypothetical protein ABPG72_019800 [Tetrahymena utriculariae]